MNPTLSETRRKEITISSGAVALHGTVTVPPEARGVVIFPQLNARDSDAPRGRRVAEQMHRRHLATVRFDLLSPEEAVLDESTAELRFDIPLLADRLMAATHWVERDAELDGLGIGYLGAGSGLAAALVAAAEIPGVQAVVSLGGRTDLAGCAIDYVEAAVLMIAGAEDKPVIDCNRESLLRLPGVKHLEIIAGAGPLFSEPGALELVTRVAAGWFRVHLSTSWLP